MVVIAALAYVLSQQDGGISSALPVLGLLALGAQRLLPSLQQIYYAWASILGSQASMADTLALLDQPFQKTNYNLELSQYLSAKYRSLRECILPLW